MKYQKIFAWFCALMLAAGFASSPEPAQAEQTVRDTTVINIVYDDSGSMFGDGNTRWSQAKYSMEVFAAMMNSGDTVNVFPMSSTGTAHEYFTMKGTEAPEQRVKQIISMTGEGGTPIQSVISAGQNLVQSSGDHKWLIILTDGEFQGLDGTSLQSVVDQFAGQSGIQVAYVGIGAGAAKLQESSNGSLECYYADETTILSTITEVAQAVYSLQKVDLSGSNPYTFDVDIPISRLILFPQGQGADITGIKHSNENFDGKAQSVHVIVDDSQSRPENSPIAPGLDGKIITYTAPDEDHPYGSGQYSFDSTVTNNQVYIEPGITFKTMLVSEGETPQSFDLEKMTEKDTLAAGEYHLEIQMVDPLSGDVIPDASSKYLKGTKLSLTVTGADGKPVSYQNGETVQLIQGENTLRTSARFPGNIQKSSEDTTIMVTSGPMSVMFSRPAGYQLNLNPLETTEPVLVSLRDSIGNPLPAGSLSSCKFEFSGTDGIDWKVSEEPSQPGQFLLTPVYASEQGALAVQNSKLTLEMKVLYTGGGFDQEGQASAILDTFTETPAVLNLELQMPDDGYTSGESSYMFSPSQTGADNSPYILVRVQAEDADGALRLLNDEEWEKGVEGFSYKASLQNPNLLWQLVRFVCGQSLDFTAVKGDEPSTYKLYLNGVNPVSILPNASDLDVSLSIKLNSGMEEKGVGNGTVTVMPLSIWAYLLWFIIIVTLIVLLVTFAILELMKHRFKRNTVVRISFTIQKSGVPQDLSSIYMTPRFKYRVWPPLKAEECSIILSSGKLRNYSDGITLRYQAGKSKTAKLLTVTGLAANATVNGLSPADYRQNPSAKCGYGQDIMIQVNKGNSEGFITVTLTTQSVKKKHRRW